MGQTVVVRDRYKNYEIIDNRMSEDMTNNIVDISRSAFYNKSDARIRSEYIKSRLDDIFPNINWSVFLYTNGYCKVSFDKNYYICAKANGYYTIIFGHEKNAAHNAAENADEVNMED